MFYPFTGGLQLREADAVFGNRLLWSLISFSNLLRFKQSLSNLLSLSTEKSKIWLYSNPALISLLF